MFIPFLSLTVCSQEGATLYTLEEGKITQHTHCLTSLFPSGDVADNSARLCNNYLSLYIALWQPTVLARQCCTVPSSRHRCAEKDARLSRVPRRQMLGQQIAVVKLFSKSITVSVVPNTVSNTAFTNIISLPKQCIYFKSGRFFKEKFQTHSKIQREVQSFPYIPSPPSPMTNTPLTGVYGHITITQALRLHQRLHLVLCILQFWTHV